jgi:low affinity Fe/Cu permease
MAGIVFQNMDPAKDWGTLPSTVAFFKMHWIRSWLTFIGVSTSHPLAFVLVAVYVALWLGFDSQSLNSQSVATVATWVMTLLIQRAEHRDTQAIHAKLDELLRAAGKADSDLAMLDQREPEEIQAHRDNALR